MRHFKLANLDDINASVYSDYVQQTVKLNLTKGDPLEDEPHPHAIAKFTSQSNLDELANQFDWH